MSRLTLLTAFVTAFTLAFVPGAQPFASQATAKQYAVLIGVNQYQHSKLPALRFAVNDATDLHKLLAAAGYEAILLTNDTETRPTREAIDKAVHDVLRKAAAADTVILAFAGHGLQFEGDKDSYFCPIDARPFKDETKSLVSMGAVYSEMEKSFAGVKILLVDACRDDPDAGRGSRGIDADSAPRPPRGVAAFFSCSAGQKAYEHADLKHGVFFNHILDGLRGEAKNSKNEVTFNSLVDYVGGNVERDVPKLIGGGAQQQPNQKADLKGHSPVLLALSGTKAPDAKVESGERKPGEVMEVEIARGMKMKFCWIPAGKATLGSPESEKHRGSDEEEYQFTTKGFWLGKHAVTQEQWEAVMGKNPSWFSKDGGGKDQVQGLDTSRFPVEHVSWDDCQKFVERLKDKATVPNAMDKGKFSLPREDEWEYACRGGKGNKQAFYFGGQLNGNQANCAGTSPYGTTTEGPSLGRPAPVGRYEKEAPHPWGLCDMSGNVCQWCQSKYDNQGSRRVLRGGSFLGYPWSCRSAYRVYDSPVYRLSYDWGFRVAVLP